MKKIYCIACLLTTLFLAGASMAFAQDDTPRVRNANEEGETVDPEPEKGFKKENLFTGGNFTASFGRGFTVLGVSPMLGYKLNDYFDAGVVINYVYTGTRDYRVYNDKLRQHTFGPGVFMRAYPVPFLFAQAQPEFNVITQKYIDGASKQTKSVSAPSLLLGGGFASGRVKGSTNFFYMSVLVDVLKNENSPYVDISINPDNGTRSVRMAPVIRAGYNIGLFQGKRNRQMGRY